MSSGPKIDTTSANISGENSMPPSIILDISKFKEYYPQY